MSQHSFSPHPVYRNARWPGSYLIHPLSIVPVKPEPQIECRSYFPFSVKHNNTPIKILDWIQSSQNSELGCDLGLNSSLPASAETVSAPISPREIIALEGTVAKRISAVIEKDRRIKISSQ